MYVKYWMFSSTFYILLEIAVSHLDQQCNFSMLCLNSLLVPIKHAFCDKDNRCRCQDGFVAITPHRCAEIQSPGKPCEHDNVCKLKDPNSFCDNNRMHPICECKKSHVYDSEQKKCIPYVKKSKKPTPLFPMTAIILVACIGIFCGCGIICHNFRRQPELSANVQQIRRISRSNNNGPGTNRNSSNQNNNSQNNLCETEPTSHPPLLRTDSQSSKYDDLLLYDEPPPKYEDAIKEYPEEIITEPNTPRPTAAKS